MIIRVNKSKDFTVMNRYHLKDRRLSNKAKGLLSVMLSLPEDWDYSIEGLTTLSNDGESGIKAQIKELEEFNYLKRYRVRDAKGKIIDMNYEVFEKPLVENPLVENPPVGKPPVENQGQYSIEEIEELNNKKEKEYKKKFTPPTLQELTDYINEHNLNVDPERWMNYYQSNGFKVGNRRMLDWKASVRYWASSEKKEKKKFTLDEMDVTEEAKKVDFDAIKKGWKK